MRGPPREPRRAAGRRRTQPRHRTTCTVEPGRSPTLSHTDIPHRQPPQTARTPSQHPSQAKPSQTANTPYTPYDEQLRQLVSNNILKFKDSAQFISNPMNSQSHKNGNDLATAIYSLPRSKTRGSPAQTPASGKGERPRSRQARPAAARTAAPGQWSAHVHDRRT